MSVPRLVLRTPVAIAFLLACAAATPSVAQTVYTVNATADPGDGTCDAAECTLREALDAANGHPNGSQPDEVRFDVPGAGVHTISPATPLPAITDPVVIDGYTQPGASPNTLDVGNDAVLRIELDGTPLGAGASGLVITAGHSTIRGLVINRFTNDGIVLQTGEGNTVEGCFIGTDPTGTTALLVGGAAVFLDGTAENVIGGTSPAARNVLIGNLNPALYTEGAGAGNNTIQGNYVGTNAGGTATLGLTGILLTNSGNLVGGTAPGARNVISTLGRAGVMLAEEGAADNTIQGNYIGVTADGTAALSATGSLYGIEVQRAPGTLIGGPTATARNVIVAATGIYLFDAAGSGVGTAVQGNYIGTNAAGTAALPGEINAGAGIRIEGTGNNTVGGTEAGAGNVVAGFNVGVLFYGAVPGNVVQGNYIGTDAAGMAALPNITGISFGGFSSDDGNLIGGSEAGARNVISGNLGHGIYLGGSDNTIQGNYIGLASDGATPLGNRGDGIQIGAGDDNLIGGTEPGEGNVIAYNGPEPGDTSDGIRLFDGHGNALLGNALFGNHTLGINLFGGTQGPNEATDNDPGDADDGPNGLQNFPVLTTSTLTGGQLTVVYSVDTDPAAAAYPLRVEFFRAEDGQGAAFLGADAYTEADHDGCGSPPCAKTTTFAPSAPVALSDALVATATDADGNTSELTISPISVPVEPSAEAPAAPALYAPAPNPATGRAALRYDVAETGRVRLAVYDLLGREVAVLVDAPRPAGRYTAALDVAHLAAGVYVARLETGPAQRTRRLTVVH